jgi:hypothetical protein
MSIMRNILFPLLILLLFGIHGTVLSQSFTASITSDDSEVCQGSSVAAYLYFAGGVGPWNAVINDQDGEYIVLDGITSPYTIMLSPDADNTYYIASTEDSESTVGNPLGEVVITVNPSTPVSIVIDHTTFLQSEEEGVNLGSSPSGGVFLGAGVVGNVFYPSIAGSAGSPHTITCTYTNQYECKSTDEIDLNVLSGVAEVTLETGGEVINVLCDDGATYYIYGSNEDNIPGTFELVAAGSTVAIPNHISDVNTSDDEAILDPIGLSGAYDIVYTYEMDGVTGSSTFRFHVNDLGHIEISDLPDTVCKNDNPYPLIPELIDNDPTATYSFSGPGVSGSQGAGYFFDPASESVPDGESEITMDYTSSNGCKAKTIKTVYNSFVPTVDFTISPVCLPVDGGTVSFTNMTSGKFSVASWSWDFDDSQSGSNNYSTLEHPQHFYSEPSYRRISLTAATYEGCLASYTVDTLLVDQPDVDFTWLNDCFIKGEHTALLDRTVSTFAEIDTLVWTFKTLSGGVLGYIGSGSPNDTIESPITSLDHYIVDLHIENEAGCSGDKTKEIILTPLTKVGDTGYKENFNGDAMGWFGTAPDQMMSWVLDEPDFAGFDQVSDDKAWFTNLPDHTNGYLEESWVQSQCFDFSGLTRPLIQLDLMRSFVPGTDGAVLQYQEYVSDGWKTVGNVGEGLNWYNEQGIYNEPGGSNFGWGLALFNPDSDWLTAGYALDMLAGMPHVKFRIVIASGGTQAMGNQGFAFDNFFIGDRMRKSVLEHFTNAASESAEAADEVVDALAVEQSGNLIDLQYHVDYPGEDAMNANNPFPLSARASYYGVEYVGVPYAVLNGGVGSDTRFTFSDPSQEPDEAALDEASLEIPPFKVALSVDYMENRLESTINVTCTADTFDSNLDLYVVVIEREVTAYTGLNQDTSFRNVVLDILPSPGGKLLGNTWYNGKTDTRTYSWDYAEYVEDIEDLSVVAFVTDRDNNGEVLQADAKPHTPGVGISERNFETGSLTLYPNPASDHIYINYGDAVSMESQLKILDLSGRVLMHSDVQPGYTIQRVDISILPPGSYMIYWIRSGDVLARNKVIVTR